MVAASATPVQVGEVLAGKYRVERVLGIGGMGVVVAAMHLQLERRVALKFMLPEVLANKEAVERFLREARAAVRLKSEHVARIIDVGTLDTGSPYIVMEYLEGTDLAAILRDHGPLPVHLVAEYIMQALEALAEAHAVGIVHRDLKPGNLFVTQRADGSAWVKVLDFGISKSAPAAGDLSLTRTQAIMGSPAYMSPEQMRASKLADARSDIWSLGVILYELVSGRVPFASDAFSELVLKVAMDPLPPLGAIAPLPGGFEAVVQRCLEKDPAARFQNVAELAAALAPFAPPSAGLLVERTRNLLRHQMHTMAMPAAAALSGPPPMAGQTTPLPYQPTPAPSHPTTLGSAAGQTVAPPARGSARTIGLLAGPLGAVALAVVLFVSLRGGGEGDGDAGENPAAAAPGPKSTPEPLPSPAPTPQPPAPPPPAPPATPEPAPVAVTTPDAGTAAPARSTRRKASKPRKPRSSTPYDPLANPE